MPSYLGNVTMDKRWLALGGSIILAAGAWTLITTPKAENSSHEGLQTSFSQDKTQELAQKQQNGVNTTQTTSTQKSSQVKLTTDLYQSFRNQNLFVSDANEANQILSQRFIPSHRTQEAFVFDEAKYGSNGSTYYTFQQTYDGLEVYGAEVAVQVSSTHQLESIIGKYSTALAINTQPSIQGDEALETTLNHISDGDPILQTVYEAPKLIIYMDYDDRAHLAYESIVKYNDTRGQQRIEKLFIDANSAELIESIDRVHTERSINVYTLDGGCVGGGANLPGSMARSSDTAVDDRATDSAYDALNMGYYFYKNMFNRFSYDGDDAKIVATVDARFSNGGSCSGLNAFFSPDDKQLAFGTGDSSTNNFAYAVDVVGHELAHAVTWKSANLEYKNESGALNESLSDIFGSAIQTWITSGGSADANPSAFNITDNTWIVGEQLGNEKFLRYMNDPTKDDKSRDNYEDKYTQSSDNGGVHYNSGITNLSFALLVEGGKHPQNKTDVEVPGIGMDKAIRIWYEAQATTMNTRTDYDNVRASLANAAASLYEECSPEYKAVQLSMDAVKMPGTWECAEPDTTAPLISEISPSDKASGVAVDSVMRVSFNEPMDKDTLNTSNIFVTDSSDNSIEGSLSVKANTVSFTPNMALNYESEYRFSVTTGVSDLAGNNLQESVSLSFTTASKPDASDKLAPTITEITPVDGAIDVSVETEVSVSFSEEMNTSSLTQALSLVDVNDVVVSASISVSGSKITLRPKEPLQAGSSYKARVSTQAQDLAGNLLENEKSWSFITLQEDSTSTEVSLQKAELSASSQYNASYGIENIRDGKSSTEWVSRTNRGGYYQAEWIQIDLAEASEVQRMQITWNGYYFPREMQLWAVVNGSWVKLQEISKYSAGETAFEINENVESLHLAMRGGRYGSWFVIKELSVD